MTERKTEPMTERKTEPMTAEATGTASPLLRSFVAVALPPVLQEEIAAGARALAAALPPSDVKWSRNWWRTFTSP